MLENFDRDLAKGRRGELIAVNTLQHLLPDYKIEDVAGIREYRYKGDIILTSPTGQKYFIEVKNDERIAETRNVLCEDEVYYKDTDIWAKGNMYCDSDIYAVVSEQERKIYFFDFKKLQAIYKRLGWPHTIHHKEQDTYARMVDMGLKSMREIKLGTVNY